MQTSTFNQKPPTIKSNRFKKWLRIHFLSSYLQQIPKYERTLDLGCGYGFSFEINPNFHGVEIDDDCVEYCQKQGFHVTKTSLLTPLPFENETFDNCFSHDVLEHFELSEIENIFRHVYAILRGGGCL